ncbi:S8 family peptidase [Desulfovibrio sp. UCD-KL4C]|uniref:S8 family peptidase n=1 Tax=Desulfovibrio sp. UCD-KL4C TaxID=2578120 RepID=UPI0025C5FBCB|nr:S8 family peptidase [Desulfovibrio sp. UCD-KL4C]
MSKKQFPHIFLQGKAERSGYTQKPPFFEKNIPFKPRREHAKFLRRKFDQAWSESKEFMEHRSAVALPTRTGTYLEFEGEAGCDFPVKSLENIKANVRLLNVHKEIPLFEDKPVVKATVYIPAGQERIFISKLEDYENPEKDGKSPKNAPLLNCINNIKQAFLDSLWRDDSGLMPHDEPAWCEVWLKGDEDGIEQAFRDIAEQVNLPVRDGVLIFPERTVVMVKADCNGLRELMDSSDHLAEFRLAKETAEFWTSLTNVEQLEWGQNLLDRLRIDSEAKVAVCVLDSGVNNGHQLLEPLLHDDDCHSVKPSWGTYDHDPHGHGTLMCGLAGYGDLQRKLETDNPIEIFHKLESVKILPPSTGRPTIPELYGLITSQAVSRVEIQSPDRTHLMCMAVASTDGRDRGRPSSWSAAIDAITSGADDGNKRLFIVAAGNTDEMEDWNAFPNSNIKNSVHDPGQSWNALTVGAYTEKGKIYNDDLSEYTAIARCGEISPYTTTSRTWEGTKWPTKPDVVMEGGNILKDKKNFCTISDETCLISLSHTPLVKQFDLFYATSAATAQAGWLAAQIQTKYPDAWPETVRGLIVHSAKWTEAMEDKFLKGNNKGNYAKLLRTCGHGVPSLQRALRCASNRLTLIAQEALQPFGKKDGRVCTKDMHVFDLPWPKDVLADLGAVDVTLKITLSYYIEPSPGEVGWTDRYRYPSHTLRFALNNPGESRGVFEKRLTTEALEEGEKPATKEDTGRWTIGSNQRHLGSVHSDMLTGTAADLADCHLIGIYPVIGWWRGRAWLGKLESKARYSLIVSLFTPAEHLEQVIDIYTPVANQVRVSTEIPI